MTELDKVPQRKSLFEGVYNKIARNYFLPLFLKSDLSPNQITVIAGLTGLLGCVCLANGFFLMAAILINMSSILDLVDGDVARVKGLQSKFGHWLDIFFDKIIDLGLVLALLTYAFKSNVDNQTNIFLVFLTLAFIFLNQMILVVNALYFSVRFDSISEYQSAQKDSLLSRLLGILAFLKLHFSLNHNAFLFAVSVLPLFVEFQKLILILTIWAFGTVALVSMSNFYKLRGL